MDKYSRDSSINLMGFDVGSGTLISSNTINEFIVVLRRSITICPLSLAMVIWKIENKKIIFLWYSSTVQYYLIRIEALPQKLINPSIEIVVAKITEAFEQLKFFCANENVVLLTLWYVCRPYVVEYVIKDVQQFQDMQQQCIYLLRTLVC